MFSTFSCFFINMFSGLVESGCKIISGRLDFVIRGSHPWLTILLLPGLRACNIVLSQENSLGFTKVLLGVSRFYLGFTRFYLVFTIFY